MDNSFTITELESLLNVTQFLIDNLMREAKINSTISLNTNQKLQKLTRYRTEIMSLIDRKLDEFFKED